jgi:hypothetical protein
MTRSAIRHNLVLFTLVMTLLLPGRWISAAEIKLDVTFRAAGK